VIPETIPCGGSGEQRQFAPEDITDRSATTGRPKYARVRCSECGRGFTARTPRGEVVIVPRHRQVVT